MTVLRREQFLKSCGGQLDHARQMAAMFQDQFQRRLREINEAGQAHDLLRIGELAHSMKGAALQFGGEAVGHWAKIVEECAATSDQEQMSQALATLTGEVQCFLEAVAAAEWGGE